LKIQHELPGAVTKDSREDQMVNKLLGLAAGSLMVLGAGSALADGTPRQAYASPVCAPSNFAGFYVGGHVGYAIAGTNATMFDDDVLSEAFSSDNQRGATYGAHVGYNYQRCNLVLGVEGDWTWMNGDASNRSADGDTVTSRVRDLGSVRGRAGVVVDNTLFYATAGYGWAQASYTFFDADLGTAKFNLNESGLVYGAGAEFQLRPGVLLRAEYLRYSFGKDAFAPDMFSGATSGSYRLSDVDTIRVGLSFKFDRDRYVPAPLK
jgi:outer membrane immunogenic protein